MRLAPPHRIRLAPAAGGLIGSLVVAFLSIRLSLWLVAAAATASVAFYVIAKGIARHWWSGTRWGWPLLMVLIPFYFSPYTDVAPSMRDPGKYVSIYYHFGGVVCLMDVLLVSALAVVLLSRAREGRINLSLGAWQGIVFFFAIILCAFVVGLLHTHAGLLRYGVTEFKRPIIALMPALYMLATFILVHNSVQSRLNLLKLLNWLDRLTALLILYGLYRLVMIAAGRTETMWMFGLPIVLYDQMAMLYVPIFVLAARAISGVRLRFWHWSQLGIMLFFILCSTRRFNYFLLVAGIALLVGLSYAAGLLRLRRLRRSAVVAVATLGLPIVLSILVIPRFAEGVLTSFKSIDVASRIGKRYGGHVRAAVIDNMFANLDRRPYAYLSGFGLGTMWQAIEDQPIDPFTRRLRRDDGWYVQFSTPYVSLLFRLGLVGTFVLLLWLAIHLRPHVRRLRSMDESFRPLALASMAFLILTIPALSDSLNPTGWVLCGLYMAILERLKIFAAEGGGVRS